MEFNSNSSKEDLAETQTAVKDSAKNELETSFLSALISILMFIKMLISYTLNGFNISLHKKHSKIWENSTEYSEFKNLKVAGAKKGSNKFTTFLCILLFLAFLYLSHYLIFKKHHNTTTVLVPSFSELQNLNYFYINIQTENVLISLFRYVFNFLIFTNTISFILIIIYHFNKPTANQQIWSDIFEIISAFGGGISCKLYKYLN